MKEDYRKLGDLIQLVDERNQDLAVKDLVGLSISKEFIPSVANTIGSNMRLYKIIRKNQFACSLMQVRRDKKIPIALQKEFDEAIISQAYPVFEVKNLNEILPEYLMMWFSRKEFDREATFHAVGGVRGSVEWDDFADFELPVPSMAEQQKIIDQYHSVENKIKTNEAICEKLEAAAQALYKHWFVDFEFPNDEGKPYQSSGGKMIWNEELEKEIPEGWEVKSIGEVAFCNPENLSNSTSLESIYYLDTSNITNNNIDELQFLNLQKDDIPSRAKRIVRENDIVFSTVRPNLRHFGILKNIPENLIVSTGFCVLRTKGNSILSEVLYLSIIQERVLQFLQGKAEMSVSTYPSITSNDLLNLRFCFPEEMSDFIQRFRIVYDIMETYNNQNQKLRQLQELLLSRMVKRGLKQVIN